MTGVAEAGLVLGLISSAIAIFDSCSKVYDAAHDVSGLPREFHEAAERLPAVTSVLRNYEHSLAVGSGAGDDENELVPVLRRCQKNAQVLKKLFDESVPGENASILKRTWAGMSIVLNGKKVRDHMKKVEKALDFLASCRILRAHSDGLASRLDAALKGLYVTDPEADMTRIVAAKDDLLHDCYNWIMSDSDLQRWQTDPSCRLLRIGGDPGKGKTMLMIALIQDLENHAGNVSPMTYFLCQSTDSTLNNATSVLRGLIWKLLSRFPSIGDDLYRNFEKAGDRLFQGPSAFYNLSSILSKILCHPQVTQVNLLIDALDECDIDKDKLLSFIAQECTKTGSKAKWLVSSRNHRDIEQSLSSASVKGCTLSLELNSTHIAKAVDIFIDHKANKLAESKNLGSAVIEQVKRKLKNKADDTFLWVALICKELEKNAVLGYQVVRLFEAFPAGLKPFYARMLEKVLQQHEDTRKHSTSMMRCVVLAYRPVSLGELTVLAGFEDHIASDEQAVVELVQSCGSFIQVRKGICYFVHQSAKDYLVGDGKSSLFQEDLESEHVQIVYRSLDAMSKAFQKDDICSLLTAGAPPPSDEVISASPLRHVRYACCFWVDHIACLLRNSGTNCDASGLLTIDARLDQRRVHEFLYKLILRWIEAVALIQQLDLGIKALQNLGQMIKDTSDGTIHRFIQDAIRITMQCRAGIENAPLQIYSSALAFAPTSSIIRQKLAAVTSDWLDAPLPQVATTWGALQHTLEGHTRSVRSVAYSPDGRWLASGSSDRTVRVWDAETGALQRTLEGHTEAVRSVIYSPDGRWLASGSEDYTVRFWNAETGALQRTLEYHTGIVTSVAYSPVGRWLASSSSDCNVRVWDAATGALQHTLEGHTYGVNSVAFSPDGNLLASASDDRTVRLWNIDLGVVESALLQTLEGHTDWVRSVAFSPDGNSLASASYDKTVRLWNIGVDNAALLQTLEGHIGWVNSVAFSPGGNLLASASYDETVRLWNIGVDNCTLLQTLEGHTGWVRFVAFSPDGKQLASASPDEIRLWDAQTGELQKVSLDPPLGAYRDLRKFLWGEGKRDFSFSDNGDWLLYGGARLLWIPSAYRPETFAYHGDNIAVGCDSGLVYMLRMRPNTLKPS